MGPYFAWEMQPLKWLILCCYHNGLFKNILTDLNEPY